MAGKEAEIRKTAIELDALCDALAASVAKLTELIRGAEHMGDLI